MKTVRGENGGGVAALIVLCIFAMLALSVLMLGAVAYKNITAKSREGYDARIGLSYVWTRVKNSDEAGMVNVRNFDGTSAIYLDEHIGGSVYHTIIYYYDGWIFELFTETGDEFQIGDGVPVVEAEALHLKSLKSGHIVATSGLESVFIHLRSREGIPYIEGGQ